MGSYLDSHFIHFLPPFPTCCHYKGSIKMGQASQTSVQGYLLLKDKGLEE